MVAGNRLPECMATRPRSVKKRQYPTSGSLGNHGRVVAFLGHRARLEARSLLVRSCGAICRAWLFPSAQLLQRHTRCTRSISLLRVISGRARREPIKFEQPADVCLGAHSGLMSDIGTSEKWPVSEVARGGPVRVPRVFSPNYWGTQVILRDPKFTEIWTCHAYCFEARSSFERS